MKAPNTTVADQVRMVNLDVAQDETKVENQSMAEDEAVVESQPFQSERGSKRLASATFMNSWWSEIIFCIGGLVISMSTPSTSLTSSSSTLISPMQSSSSFFGYTTRSHSPNGPLALP